MQPYGRDRGSKTRPPTFEVVASKMTREDGDAVEVQLGHRLASEILPFIIPNGDRLEGGGSDRFKVKHFLDRLDELLLQRVSLIRKRLDADSPYTSIELTHGPTGYEVGATQDVARPNDDVIWLEAHQEHFPGQSHRLIRRTQGSLSVIVVGGDPVTHHAPSARSIGPQYIGDALSPAFASDLPDEFFSVPTLWIHGQPSRP